MFNKVQSDECGAVKIYTSCLGRTADNLTLNNANGFCKEVLKLSNLDRTQDSNSSQIKHISQKSKLYYFWDRRRKGCVIWILALRWFFWDVVYVVMGSYWFRPCPKDKTKSMAIETKKVLFYSTLIKKHRYIVTMPL